jgi:hypothetical protein
MAKTPTNDHDLLIRLDEKVDGLTKKIDEVLDTYQAQINTLEANKASKIDVDDHENRIRFIERYVWGAIAIIGLISFIGVGGFVYIITNLK